MSVQQIMEPKLLVYYMDRIPPFSQQGPFLETKFLNFNIRLAEWKKIQYSHT